MGIISPSVWDMSEHSPATSNATKVTFCPTRRLQLHSTASLQLLRCITKTQLVLFPKNISFPALRHQYPRSSTLLEESLHATTTHGSSGLQSGIPQKLKSVLNHRGPPSSSRSEAAALGHSDSVLSMALLTPKSYPSTSKSQ